MNRFLQALQRFMYGRYGNDQLNRFLSWIALAVIIVDLFVKNRFLWMIGVLLLLVMYFRMFSKNTAKRYAENQKYMNLMYKLRGGKGRTYSNTAYDMANKMAKWKYKMDQRKIYRFFHCPQCSQKVRVPKGKGKIEITCPKCRTAFIKRT